MTRISQDHSIVSDCSLAVHSAVQASLGGHHGAHLSELGFLYDVDEFAKNPQGSRSLQTRKGSLLTDAHTDFLVKF